MDCVTAITGLSIAISAMAAYIVKLHRDRIKAEREHTDDLLDLYADHGGRMKDDE